MTDPAPGTEPATAAPTTADPLAASVTLEDGDGYTRGLGEKAGALIEIIRPDDWNGNLVLLMHGLTPASDPVTLRHPLHWQTQPAVDDLIARGYGVALSSYRTNGPAVAEGTIDTRIAQATFTSEFGRSDRTYLWGWSMGGAIGHQLLEHASVRYDGFLSVCSDQIGPIPLDQYQLDARLLFDYFFPGVLPWAIGEGDAELFTEVLPAIQVAFFADPPGYIAKVHKMAAIDQLQLPLGTGTPTGRTQGTPILALHTDGDAVVPVRFAQQYEEVAAETGNADTYVLRVVPGFAHCELTPDVAPDGFADIQIEAFDDLVAWVENGVKPAP